MFAFAVLLALAATVSALPRETAPLSSNNPTIDPTANWKVVGGSDAYTGEFPYMASVRGPVNNHFCGGSIITSRTILTAGHCLIGEYPSIVFVVAGTNQLTSGGVSIGAESLIIYPGYDLTSPENDIGVVILQTAYTLNNLIAPVYLDYGDVGAVDVTLTGWGVLYYNGPTPDNLQRLHTRTIENSECERYWTITRSHICAYSAYGEGSCVGDSGGPLVVRSNGVQAGIVSSGSPCAVGIPDIYTRVFTYTSWINSVARW